MLYYLEFAREGDEWQRDTNVYTGRQAMDAIARFRTIYPEFAFRVVRL